LINVLAIWSKFTAILLCLIYFMVVWYIFPRFGMLYQGKSGNPAEERKNAFSKSNATQTRGWWEGVE
jgi:hypothetical protein